MEMLTATQILITNVHVIMQLHWCMQGVNLPLNIYAYIYTAMQF